MVSSAIVSTIDDENGYTTISDEIGKHHFLFNDFDSDDDDDDDDHSYRPVSVGHQWHPETHPLPTTVLLQIQPQIAIVHLGTCWPSG